jgi:hypothetical protein
MATLQDLVVDLIKDLTALQHSATPWQPKDDDFPLPRMIPAGDGGGIIISKKIEGIITTVARRIKENDPALRTTHTDAEWITAVRNAFGPALFPIDLADDPGSNAEKVLASVKAAVKARVPSGPMEYAFGCTLFSNADVAAFEIGPVRFEVRLEWLARKASEEAVSKVTRRRVERAWQGQRLSKRKSSYDSIRENDILDAIGSCPYVCSVSTAGLAPEAGKEKALTAARLALASVALLWETPSRALEGFNLLYDRNVRRQKALSFTPGKITLAGSQLSHMPHGPSLKPGEWQKMFAQWSDHFSVSGEILEYWLSADGKVRRPTMMNRLAQALLWFHEACRETVTLMTIVKFTACMDGLGGAKEEQGILQLLDARLGIRREATIRADGPTVKQVISKIYGEGRSRTVHGTNDNIGFDWSVTAGHAQQFARLCLLSCINWAATNPGSDDPRQLLK